MSEPSPTSAPDSALPQTSDTAKDASGEDARAMDRIQQQVERLDERIDALEASAAPPPRPKAASVGQMIGD